MKRIITLSVVALVLLLGGADLQAQSKSSKTKKKPEPVKLDPMFYKGGKFTAGSNMIPQYELDKYFAQSELQQVNLNLQKRKTGVGLLIGGGAGFAVFSALGTVGLFAVASVGPSMAIAGYSAAVASAGVLIAGIPVYCKAEKRLKEAADGYNQRNNIQVSLTLRPYGPGLSLNF